MNVSFHENSRVFRLDTPNSTYQFCILDKEGFLAHLYYGRRIPDDLPPEMLRTEAQNYPSRKPGERLAFQDGLQAEYPGDGLGDMKEPCLCLRTPEGFGACGLTYKSHAIYGGKPALPGLPATYGGEDDCATLEVVAEDGTLGLTVRLYYTAFTKIDAICRSARIENTTGSTIRLERALSLCLDMDGQDPQDLLTLHGNWSAERMINRRPITMGKQGVASHRGISSHQEQPFLAVLDRNATQLQGEVRGFNLVYSGNFLAQTELTQQGQLRLVMGIHPRDFSWQLLPGESFQTPEAVMTWSGTGLSGMTHAFHDLYRNHLVRGPYKNKERPSLVNNWEATYFGFDTEKILSIGREAAKAGIEMLVLDDGWFGKRDDDHSGLGDWVVNERKLPGGLKYLSEELNRMGLRFGLWVEPEMVSPDSDLYRAHPDYALQIPGRTPTQSRNQLVLDYSRKEVRDAVYSQIFKVLSEAKVAYVKWDMNRALTDVYSPWLGPDRQGELYHRYMLGVYELQERLVTDFPELLLENCCSGGGRFDAGMLYYSPQIWTSDNTEAIDRLAIQEGTALVYPLSSMGAHVAACPSHTNQRTTPFETRGRVSLPGCFGYELDLTRLTPEEKAMIPTQLEEYRKFGPVFHDGDYYRLASFRENHSYDALMAISKDRKTAVIDYVEVESRARFRAVRLNPAGLAENLYYRSSLTGEVRSGAGWMYAGLLAPRLEQDYSSALIVLTAVEEQA